MSQSLLSRAIAFLARREYSAAELRRKLAPHAESPDELDALFEVLKERGFLSEARFAESIIERQSARKGASWIRHHLKQHQIAPELIESASGDLEASEEARARALWERRFGTVSQDPKERLRQMRFLASRGFSHDVIRRITRQA